MVWLLQKLLGQILPLTYYHKALRRYATHDWSFARPKYSNKDGQALLPWVYDYNIFIQQNNYLENPTDEEFYINSISMLFKLLTDENFQICFSTPMRIHLINWKKYSYIVFIYLPVNFYMRIHQKLLIYQSTQINLQSRLKPETGRH